MADKKFTPQSVPSQPLKHIKGGAPIKPAAPKPDIIVPKSKQK